MTMPAAALAICTALAAAALAFGSNAFAGSPAPQPIHEPARPAAVHDLALRLAQDRGAEPDDTKKPVNTIAEVFAALEACWVPPTLAQARAGMQITVMVSFKRSGELLGKPRITYETPEASDDERMAYRLAMAEALRRCTPLRFTDALGNALAGRPLTLRFIDNRKLKQAGTADVREC
jgi:hypothetical protein